MPFTIGEIPIGNVVDGELVLRDVTFSYGPQVHAPILQKQPPVKHSPVRGGAGGIVRQPKFAPDQPRMTTMAIGEEGMSPMNPSLPGSANSYDSGRWGSLISGADTLPSSSIDSLVSQNGGKTKGSMCDHNMIPYPKDNPPMFKDSTSIVPEQWWYDYQAYGEPGSFDPTSFDYAQPYSNPCNQTAYVREDVVSPEKSPWDMWPRGSEPGPTPSNPPSTPGKRGVRWNASGDQVWRYDNQIRGGYDDE